MTQLINDPAIFTDEMLEGFCALYPQYVSQVSGGVVRSTPSTPGKVAVVIGGGSGHYPAFCGTVGKGFADGAKGDALKQLIPTGRFALPEEIAATAFFLLHKVLI